MLFHTIPEILSYANEAYGADDAIRWKKSKNEIESRTYSELKNDTDSFANAIEKLGKKGQHIAVIGPSSYEWIVSYLAITESGSVAVPIDASLPAADICELLDRADVRMLIFDEARSDVAEAAAKSCHDIKKYTCIPFELDPYNANILHLAMADPMDMAAIDDISIVTNLQIEPYIATTRDILAAIDRCYGASGNT